MQVHVNVDKSSYPSGKGGDFQVAEEWPQVGGEKGSNSSEGGGPDGKFIGLNCPWLQ